SQRLRPISRFGFVLDAGKMWALWCCSGSLHKDMRSRVLSRKLFENVNSLFANESDGYKTTSAPSAFRFSCGRNARTGQESTPEQSECHYRNRHQEDLSHRCRGRHRGSPASVFQSQTQETSSAADPATAFDRVNRFPS